MTENKKTEISLLDIAKLLYEKKLLIVIVTLVGIVLGGIFGIITAGSGNYSSQLQFSVTSTKLDNNALQHFKSDSFLEQLLLDENGLPVLENPDNPSEDYVKAAKAREDFIKANKRYKEIEKELYELSVELSDALLQFEAAESEYQYAVTIYAAFAESSNGTTGQEKLTQLESNMIAKEQAYNSAKSKYHNLKHKDSELRTEDSLLDYKIPELQEIKNQTANVLLDEWRGLDTTKKALNTLKQSVIISYPTGTGTSTQESKILIVSLNIGDEKLANQVSERLVQYIPEYVGDFDGVLKGNECVLLSTNANLETPGSGALVKNIIKYAAFIGVAALAVVCVALAGIYVCKAIFIVDGKKITEVDDAEEKE